MTIEALSLSDLPAVGEQLEGGAFAGITTLEDGSHAAVVLLPDRAEEVTGPEAVTWASQLGAALPTPTIASLLYSNLQPLLTPAWHWTAQQRGALGSYCQFDGGSLGVADQGVRMSAVAVIQLVLQR